MSLLSTQLRLGIGMVDDDITEASVEGSDSFVVMPSRRTFLAMMAGTAAVIAVSGSDPVSAVAGPGGGVTTPKVNNFTLQLTRTSDMVDLTLRFSNLAVGTVKGVKVLQTSNPLYKSYLVVEFPSQHVAEETQFLTGETPTSASGVTAPTVTAGFSTGSQQHHPMPLRSRFAAPSRLAFQVNPSAAPVPFTAAGLLNWTSAAFTPLLPAAAAHGQPYALGRALPLTAPSANTTSIEFPYGLVLSPTPAGRWHANTAPITHATRTQVWAADLADPSAAEAAMRAVWTTQPGYGAAPANTTAPTPSPNPGFLSLPTQRDRWQLVRLTTDRPLSHRARVDSPVLRAKKFRMSSIGATVDLHGEFNPGTGLDIQQYVHRAFAGRDVYVRVVHKGFLYPSGHAASEVVVSERVFAAPPAPGAATGTVAYLQEHVFLVLRESTRTYQAPGGPDSVQTRAFPFTSVTIDTPSSPPVNPTLVPGEPNTAQTYVPIVDGDCFRWSATVVDKMGTTHKVRIPLIFVRDTYGSANWPTLKTHYDSVSLKYRTIDLEGLHIGFAPEVPGIKVGGTTFPTFHISLFGPIDFTVRIPKMDFAGIGLDALRGFAGLDSKFAFRFPDIFLGNGFGGLNLNGLVFGRFFDPLADLGLPGFGGLGINFPDISSIGGLFSPNFSISGLSGIFGSFGGDWPDISGFPSLLDGLGGLDFDPLKWFSGFPKLLGGIDFSGILGAFSGVSLPSLDLGHIPNFDVKIEYEDILGVKVPMGITIGFTFCTDKLKSFPDAPDDQVFIATDSTKWSGTPPAAPAKTEFCVSASITVKLKKPSSIAVPEIEPSVDASAVLKNFEVSLFGSGTYRFVVLEFESLTFEMKTGSDPKVTPSIRNIDFEGALRFVKNLASHFLPEGGLFGGGGKSTGLDFTPIFDVDSKHVEVGFDLGIPTIAVGVFSLANLEIGILINLPFDSAPLTASFHVCRVDKPFMLSVGFLGGGGFFALEVGLDGVRRLEVSLEFGANAQVDLGIASGGVSMVAGIHFLVKSSPDTVELNGYFRMNGHLQVLGIISLSCEVLLTLTYMSPPGVAKGRASVSFTVEIAFFSTTVSTEVEKTFAGSESASSAASIGSFRPALTASAVTPPLVTDFMSATDWADYVGAFAS